MESLQQIVLTRLSHGRDIDGTPQFDQGFGIYSMSEGLLSEKRDSLLQNFLLRETNFELTDQGPFTSFSYHVPDVGSPMLSMKHLRVWDPQGGIDGVSNRSGNYINQMYVGSLNDYPCAWFDERDWPAHLEAETFYYQDARGADGQTREVPFLPEVNPRPMGTGITREQAKAFVRDGRGELLSQVMAYLIQQMQLPHDKRKYLVIAAPEAEVRLWVAAIGYCLPVQSAGKLPFNTRVVEYSGSNVNAYRVLADSGKYTPQLNISLPKRYRAMIVGVQPDTRPALMYAREMDPYIVLNAAEKRLNPQPQLNTDLPYFDAVKAFDTGIEDFCKVFSVMQPIEISDRLFGCFDALAYADRMEAWEYKAGLDCFETLTALDQGEQKLSRYLCAQLPGRYEGFFTQDASNQFRMLVSMHRVCQAIGDENSLKSLTLEMASLLSEARGAFDAQEAALRAFTLSRAHLDPALFDQVVRDLFEQDSLQIIQRSLSAGKASVSESYSALFMHYLKMNNLSWLTVRQDPRLSGICRDIIVQMASHPQVAGVVFAGISARRDDWEALILQGDALLCDDPPRRRDWWDLALKNRAVDMDSLLDMTRQADVEAYYEPLLIEALKQAPKASDELDRAANRLISSSRLPCAGMAYYRARLATIRDNQEACFRLAQELRLLPIGGQMETEICEVLNALIPYQASNHAQVQSLLARAKAQDLLRSLPRLNVNAYVSQMLQISKEQDLLIRHKELTGSALPIDDAFAGSQACADYLAHMASLAETPQTHYLVFSAFCPSETFIQKFTGVYAEALTSCGKRKPEGLISGFESVLLMRSAIAGHLAPDRGQHNLIEVVGQDMAGHIMTLFWESLSAALTREYSDALAAKLLATAKKDPAQELTARLEELLAAAKKERDKHSKNPLKFIGKLFGKKE